MDIGECAAIHDLALRADYEQASESKDYGYQVDVLFSSHNDLYKSDFLLYYREFM